MCGISGFIRFDRRLQDGEDRIIKRMNEKLIHRGPDAQDTLLFENVALGFARLSIIGLSNGMQPIYNEDGSLVLICNGEIFNYIEWRETLQKKGHVFSSASDVEVILHLYEEYDTGFLNKLNGQFAFALYDKRRKRMFCARDQMGIIPFFYTIVNNAFVFGSEIKAILEFPDVKPEVDPVGLDQVLSFAGLISPRTMFKGVRSLENGHYLLVEHDGRIADIEYWDLIYPEGEMPMNGKPEWEYIAELEALFEKAISYRLRADVASGLYLSGGLDSSMIAMKVKSLMPVNERPAFAIDFVDSLYSESEYQRTIARESRSELNQIMFPYQEIGSRLKKSIYYSECPIKETYNTASLSLSERVRSNNLKVILSGEGADEFFAGYVGYRFDKMRKMSKVVNPASQREKALRYELWGDEDFFYEYDLTEFETVKRNLYADGINECYDSINCLNYPVVRADRLKGRNLLNKRAYIDYKIRLVDHLVSDHGDRMAMANSVEVRYPFLDKELVEFSAQLPVDLKLNGLTEKYILRRMGKNLLPPAILEREKFHFIAPGSPYLLQQHTEFLNDLLSYDLIKRQGYFNPDTIEQLKKQYSREGYMVNAPYESDFLIIVISFGILLETFFKH